MTIIGGALAEAKREFDSRLESEMGLAEALFDHAAVGLRHLQPYRGFVGEVVETALSPFLRSSVCEEGEQVRVQHLETVQSLISEAGADGGIEPTSITMHLYWTLYLGVLAYWSSDESPSQEDSLVVLDQATRMFVSSFTTSTVAREEVGHVSERS